MAVPNIIGTQPAGNLLASLYDVNWAACLLLDGSQAATASIPAAAGISMTGGDGYAKQGQKWIWTSTGASGGLIRGFINADSSGNVIIGANNNGTNPLAIQSTNQIVFNAGGVSNSAFHTLGFAGDTYNGQVLDDSASANGVLFTGFAIGGTLIGSVSRVSTTSAVAYNTTSDYRIKTITGDFEPGLLSQLTVHSGYMNGDPRPRAIMLAHEVKEHMPFLVTGEKDAVNADGSPKYQQMDYTGLIPFLVGEFKALRAEFDAYRATHP